MTTVPRRPAAEQFGRTADLYARSQVRRYHKETLIRLAEPRGDDRYLDVGTGPGTLVGMLGPAVAFAVGIDLTPEMLARFEPGDSRAAAIRADAYHLPFAGDATSPLGRASWRYAGRPTPSSCAGSAVTTSG